MQADYDANRLSPSCVIEATGRPGSVTRFSVARIARRKSLHHIERKYGMRKQSASKRMWMRPAHQSIREIVQRPSGLRTPIQLSRTCS